ncbi:DUF1488 family protein [Collimonas humicola]|uniref:DUF1488 family protein n=1 Tax=Collimonas humicola TaxID=2825886 RepID=UPI001B8C863D|nr:DUF1488 family protein [Collimonas humicola]
MVTIATEPSLTDDGDLSFALQFPAGYVQRFVVSREALEDLARSQSNSRADLLNFFQAHLDRIIAVATRTIGHPSNGIILLKTADF